MGRRLFQHWERVMSPVTEESMPRILTISNEDMYFEWGKHRTKFEPNILRWSNIRSPQSEVIFEK